jgi:uncharacterized repeat protein (TIGR02543 family)
MNIICYVCFEEYNETLGMCPYCGNSMGDDISDSAMHLKPGTMLKSRYVIGDVLGYGGFGVTYVGWDTILECKIAIKEYLPSEFATRTIGHTQLTIFAGEKSEQFHDGKDRFVEEANRLARFRETEGIVLVYESFQENNTAYIVMEHLDGQTLTDYMAEKGKLSAEKSIQLLMPVIRSLQKVHKQDIIHRDIAPDNIMVTKDGQVKLIDFGAARYATTSHSRSLTVLVKPGYSPEEQYRSSGDQGSWTDVYSIGATMYRMITGVTPPDAMERRAFFEGKQKDILTPLSKYADNIDTNHETAVLNAMNVRIEDRTPNMEEFEQELHEEGELKRRCGKIKRIDILKWPLWLKISVPAAACIVATLSTLFITGVIGFASNLITDYNIPAGMARVPSLIGVEIIEAGTRLADRNLQLTIIGKEDSDDIPANMILSQDISAGSIVEVETMLRVEVSGGEAIDIMLTDEEGRFFLADVQFRTREDAIERLEMQGMEIIIIEQHDEMVAPGIVISQNPEAGMPVFPETVITIVVSLGGEAFEMPNVVGSTEEEARLVLNRAGLSVNVEYVRDDSVPAGSVVGQSVPAGNAVFRGTAITITVSSDQALTQVPNMVGRQRNDARTELTRLGFEVMINEAVSDRPKDEVISQTPQGGTSIKENGLVVLTVSRGQCTITLNARGGSVSPASVTVNVGGTAVLPTPTRESFNFTGWFTAATGGTQVLPSTEITGNITVFAQWTQTGIVVTFNANGGNGGGTRRVNAGENVTNFPLPWRDHFTFNGWFTARSGGSLETQITEIENSITLYAQWTPIKYMITFLIDGGVHTTREVDWGSGPATIGPLPDPRRDFYTLSEWSHRANTRVTGNMSVTARWTLKNGWQGWVDGRYPGTLSPPYVQEEVEREKRERGTSNSPTPPAGNGWVPTLTVKGDYGDWSRWEPTSPTNSTYREYSPEYSQYRYGIFSGSYEFETTGLNDEGEEVIRTETRTVASCCGHRTDGKPIGGPSSHESEWVLGTPSNCTAHGNSRSPLTRSVWRYKERTDTYHFERWVFDDFQQAPVTGEDVRQGTRWRHRLREI